MSLWTLLPFPTAFWHFSLLYSLFVVFFLLFLFLLPCVVPSVGHVGQHTLTLTLTLQLRKKYRVITLAAVVFFFFFLSFRVYVCALSCYCPTFLLLLLLPFFFFFLFQSVVCSVHQFPCCELVQLNLHGSSSSWCSTAYRYRQSRRRCLQRKSTANSNFVHPHTYTFTYSLTGTFALDSAGGADMQMHSRQFILLQPAKLSGALLLFPFLSSLLVHINLKRAQWRAHQHQHQHPKQHYSVTGLYRHWNFVATNWLHLLALSLPGHVRNKNGHLLPPIFFVIFVPLAQATAIAACLPSCWVACYYFGSNGQRSASFPHFLFLLLILLWHCRLIWLIILPLYK